MILSIISVAALFSIIILIHEAGHFFAAKRVGIRVEKFSLGFGPKLFSVKRGDTLYQVCLLPFGGFVKMAGDEYESDKKDFENWEYMGKSPGHRSQVLVAGSLNNLILAFVMLIPVFMIGVPGYDGTKIGSFVEGLPAEKSGLMAGDEVLEVNGVKCREWFNVLMNIRSSIEEDAQKPVELKVRRDGENLVFSVIPGLFEDEEAEEQVKPVYILGISPMEKNERYALPGAVIRAGKEFRRMVFGIFLALKMLVTKQVSASQLAGPVGIATWGAELAHHGLGRFLYFVAFISVNLGIINLMPVPVFDGGHLVGLAGERVLRRRPSKKVLEWTGYVGFFLIIGLALFVTYNDVMRLLENMVKK
ncbi:MAG: RIP metalloprotease RseP [Candidatus Omnitrophica bacterium]|nr:RIP metalloprotease RseP [Candidatus Omnitrophota bacterium]